MSLASICPCCDGTETINHVFSTGNVAVQVWQHYFAIFSLPFQRFTWLSSLLMACFVSVSNKLAHIHFDVPALVAWFL